MYINLKTVKEQAKNLKLLYIEDDAIARTTTVEMLENLFTNITTGNDGEDGLRLFKEGNYDLIITDINMPHINGIEMLAKIREIDTKVSVLILSAYNESNYFLDAIKLGIDGFILKPLEHNQFLETLAKVTKKIFLDKKEELYYEYLEEEIHKRTKEIEKKLYYDDLTGLLNRYSFFKDIHNIELPILFMLDINKFKLINEIYGSKVGSRVLKEFALFLMKFAQRRNYRVYRLSSDEFILWDNVSFIDYEKYEQDLKDFFQQLNNFTVQLNNDAISIEVTIGISTSQHDAFESAKIALEYAKQNKKQYAMYSKAIDKRQEEQNALLWKQRIKEAIANNNIVPVYQAIVNKKSQVVKYETLMRLYDEETKELILPQYFLDISMKTGLYPQLSSFIILEALQKIKDFSQCLSINFTYSDIKNRLFTEKIELFLQQNIEVGPLAVFEITESESIENYNEVKEFISRFRKYGVRFAIDDFGSGFSNFEYILEIEPEYLKIDGSLIKHIDEDKKALILVRAIVQFSHELGIKTIAEFVHSKKIFSILKSLNVDEFQGFFFHKPLPYIDQEDKHA